MSVHTLAADCDCIQDLIIRLDVTNRFAPLDVPNSQRILRHGTTIAGSPLKTRMDEATLKNCLRREVDRWSVKPFDVLVAELADGAVYATEGSDSCQVEVQLLEQNADYIHVSVSVDDGGWRAFVPVSTSFLVYRDGRVEKPLLWHS